jgi:DNA-binding transcriptional LysR family regulator
MEILGDVVHVDDVQAIGPQAFQAAFNRAQRRVGAVVVDDLVAAAVLEQVTFFAKVARARPGSLSLRLISPPFGFRQLTMTCAKAGFTPDVRMQAPEPLTARGLVAAGLGIAMIPPEQL